MHSSCFNRLKMFLMKIKLSEVYLAMNNILQRKHKNRKYDLVLWDEFFSLRWRSIMDENKKKSRKCGKLWAKCKTINEWVVSFLRRDVGLKTVDMPFNFHIFLHQHRKSIFVETFDAKCYTLFLKTLPLSSPNPPFGNFRHWNNNKMAMVFKFCTVRSQNEFLENFFEYILELIDDLQFIISSNDEDANMMSIYK